MIKDAQSKQLELQNINEMKGGKLFKCDNDPRITPIGKFLRKYSIDELPQLFNILKGEMSIIGPRPLSTPISEYENYQLRRFIIKPGLFCIWQVYYRKETNFTKWMKTDLLYINKASFLVDAKLFLLMVKNVIIGKGSR
jgi:lipopolysaccharide/colanic/teichoic acid biosynthesis glycosyltransferase